MKEFRAVAIIYTMVFIVAIAGLIYINVSINAINIAPETELVSDPITLPAAPDTALKVTNYQPSISGYDLQPAATIR